MKSSKTNPVKTLHRTILLNEIKKILKRNFLRFRDIGNLLRYGENAPRYAERIWIEPYKIRYVIHNKSSFISIICSGLVTNIGKHFTYQPFKKTHEFKSCVAHWIEGLPWESTKDYLIKLDGIKRGQFWVGCKSEEELRGRFMSLDRIFYETKQTLQLKTRKQLGSKAYREEGGMIVCIGRHGEPLLFDGYHRLCIALILNLPTIPAQLGCVDYRAIDSLPKYRFEAKHAL